MPEDAKFTKWGFYLALGVAPFAVFSSIVSLLAFFGIKKYEDLAMMVNFAFPHVLLLIFGTVFMAYGLIVPAWVGIVQRRLILKLKKELKESIESRKEFANRNLEYKAKLSNFGGLFSPLQIEAFQLAKDMREFYRAFEPIPDPIDVNSQSPHVRQSQLSKRIEWRRKIEAAYELNFAERQRILGLKFDASGYPLNLRDYRHGSKGIEDVIPYEADVITARAHRVDGAKLAVEK